MSANRMAASRSKRRTGCNVTSIASSALRQKCDKVLARWRAGRDIPADSVRPGASARRAAATRLRPSAPEAVFSPSAFFQALNESLARFGRGLRRPACGPGRRLRPAHCRSARCVSSRRQRLAPSGVSTSPRKCKLAVRRSAPARRWACGRSRPAPAESRAPPRWRSRMFGDAECAPAGRGSSASSARQVMASAPWPGAGGMSSTVDQARWHGVPGPAASGPPAPDRWRRSRRSSMLLSRVSTLPRSSYDFQVGAQMQGLGLAAQAGGADHRAVRQVHQVLALVRR